MKRFIVIAISGAFALLAGCYVFLCASVDADRMLPNTVIDDVDVSNMTLESASDALKNTAKAWDADTAVTVSFYDKDYAVTIGDAIRPDYEAAAEAAFKKSRGSFLLRGLYWLKASFAGGRAARLPVSVDSDALRKNIADSGILSAGTVIHPSYETKNKQLLLTAGKEGKAADQDKLIQKIITAASAQDFGDVLKCPAAEEKPEELDLEQVYQEVHREPQNATLDPENNYKIVKSVTGVDFDKQSAQKALSEADPGSTVKVDLVYTKPEITTKNLKKHLFKDTLATFSTRVGGNSNRLTNVRLAAKKCNGSILLPEDIFSYNNTVGEQTAATGFKKASATQNGVYIQAYGGGICQVSSTIFAAALFANLDIVERWCHDYVAGYIDAGADAAVAWDVLDFRIGNNKKYPLRIDVSLSGRILTAAIKGTKTSSSYVEIQTKKLDSSTSSTLKVDTYRNVYDKNDNLVSTEKIAYSEYRAD